MCASKNRGRSCPFLISFVTEFGVLLHGSKRQSKTAHLELNVLAETLGVVGFKVCGLNEVMILSRGGLPSGFADTSVFKARSQNC